MPNVQSILDTIAREVTAGTPVATEYAVPVTTLPGLDSEMSKEPDPAIVGSLMPAGSYLLSLDNTDGGSKLSPRPVPAMALICHSALGGGVVVGNDLVGVQLGAVIRVKYTGDDASCKLVINDGAGTEAITSTTGVLGSEAADAAFGTAGVLTMAGTVGAIVSTIDGYANYEAKFVDGDRAVVPTEIIAFSGSGARQAKGKWVYIFFAGTSGGYQYEIPLTLTATERPTLSRQVDGRGQNEKYSGLAIDELSFSAAIQGYVEGDMKGPAMYNYRPHVQSGATHTSTLVDQIDTREISPGMTVTGTGIQVGTTVSAVPVFDEDGTLTLSLAATASATVDLTFGIPASTVTLERAIPFRFADGKTAIKGAVTRFIRNMSVDISNQHSADLGYGQGSFSRQGQFKGIMDVTGSVQVALDSVAMGLSDDAFRGVVIPLCFEFQSNLIAAGLKAMMIIELPFVEIQKFSRPDNSGQIDANIEYMAVNPLGAFNYDYPMTIHLIIAKETI